MVQYKFHGISASMPVKTNQIVYHASPTVINQAPVPTYGVPTGAPDYLRARIDRYFALRGLKFECGGVIKNIDEEKPIILGNDLVVTKDIYNMQNNYTFGTNFTKNSILCKP